MSTVDLKSLSAEEKEALFEQLRKEEKAKKRNSQKEKESYQTMKDEIILKTFNELKAVSEDLADRKERLLDNFRQLLEMKSELFGIKETQLSHSWTTTDGSTTIKTGHNSRDRWDETVSVGIEKVNKWLDKKAEMMGGSELVDIIRELMKPNKDGVLKANRVLDLKNHAIRLGDSELIDAVDLIHEAHRPDKTSTFIKASCKDEDDKMRYLPLSMSAV